MKSFELLGIPPENHYRVPASTTEEVNGLLRSGQLIFHPLIHLDEVGIRDKSHFHHIYSYKEGARLLSHLNAIKTAYDAGHDLALILEDDAVLSKTFVMGWSFYVDRAPSGWKVLQFATDNSHVMSQGLLLQEPFVTWQPYHWSTRAYIINRSGMQTLMDQAHSYSQVGQTIWRIQQIPMVVADEAIYTLVGNTFTSTGLWIDTIKSDTTVQSDKVNLANTERLMKLKKRHMMRVFDESILVFMNIKITTIEGMARDIQWLYQDSRVLCEFHRKCQWEINVVIANSSLITPFWRLSFDIPSYVNFTIKISSEPFNKFLFIRNFQDEMVNYDLVLLKDNDQRIIGFPWGSFVERRENAVVSGPLRQDANEAMTYNLVNRQHKADQKFYLHQAHNWLSINWGANLFAYIVPTQVPILEMYFTLLDAKFAEVFFSTILKSNFVNQTSSWGPDLLWCQAAKDWDNSRPGCNLVPVVSCHENSQQIDKSNRLLFNRQGEMALAAFRNDPSTKRWMQVSTVWSHLIHGQNLPQVEEKCRHLLGLEPADMFDLQMCSMKLFFSFLHYNYVPSLSTRHDSLSGQELSGNSTGLWSSCLHQWKSLGVQHTHNASDDFVKAMKNAEKKWLECLRDNKAYDLKENNKK
eukprot:CAMPEP_0183703776 /NCGR_PEP_ID=MMETSP0737-20130205/1388_1 /TAXON_ID=385413 /ORGANISM="Thalassiosira miniscula, Strain CCMP1093" /LENGTH=636 /DNA_ID=CAMNT_0025930573 /DNA_START=1961 /DNA_END=3871 /DNA_ORIENTATION=+